MQMNIKPRNKEEEKLLSCRRVTIRKNSIIPPPINTICLLWLNANWLFRCSTSWYTLFKLLRFLYKFTAENQRYIISQKDIPSSQVSFKQAKTKIIEVSVPKNTLYQYCSIKWEYRFLPKKMHHLVPAPIKFRIKLITTSVIKEMTASNIITVLTHNLTNPPTHYLTNLLTLFSLKA